MQKETLPASLNEIDRSFSNQSSSDYVPPFSKSFPIFSLSELSKNEILVQEESNSCSDSETLPSHQKQSRVESLNEKQDHTENEYQEETLVLNLGDFGSSRASDPHKSSCVCQVLTKLLIINTNIFFF